MTNSISILKELIQHNTENPPGKTTEILTWINNWAKKENLISNIQVYEENKGNIVIKFGKANRSILICGHLDTVPLGNRNNWDYDPLSAKLVNGYIYGDIRDELKNLWKTMLTLLGMLGVAIGYVLKGSGIAPSFWGYVIVTQLIWLFAMIEILLYSNYISKHNFLMEIEEAFEPSLKERKAKEEKGEPQNIRVELVPFWQSWIDHFFTDVDGYAISVVSITAWGFLAFIVTAAKAWDMIPCNKISFSKNWVFFLLSIELFVAICAFLITYRQYKNVKFFGNLMGNLKSILKSKSGHSS